MQERQHHLVADRRRIGKGATGQAVARLRGAEERRARGRARQRASSSISARLFERSERSERSELRDAPRALVPLGSRRAAPTALRYSGPWPVAQLAALTAFAALEQARRD